MSEISHTASKFKRFLPKKAIVMASKKTLNKEAKTETKPKPNSLDSLDKIASDLSNCKRCKLCSGRNKIVLGEGNPKAQLVFVGEGPGEQEDLQGRPFVGRAGQLLDKMIEAMGMKRSDIFIANVVKCRPPENRNPEPDEIASCSPFLFRQLDALQPKVVVALGKFAAQTLLQTEERISEIRGKIFPYRGSKLIPTFHPAYLLRNPSSKREAWEDLKTAMKEIKK